MEETKTATQQEPEGMAYVILCPKSHFLTIAMDTIQRLPANASMVRRAIAKGEIVKHLPSEEARKLIDFHAHDECVAEEKAARAAARLAGAR